jgi:exonuclease SbcD
MKEPQAIVDKPNGAFRLLHTADWHLGKLLNDLSRDEEHSRFLGWLLGVVKEHDVDAIILAGDVFDTANPPQPALRLYYDFVSGLFRQGDCALLVIAGNHDSAAQLEAPKQALHALNTHVVGFLAEKPEGRIFCLPDDKNPKVAIAMMPFLRDRDLRTGKAGESADDIRSQIVAGIRQRYAEVAEAVKAARLSCPVIATGHLTVLGAKTSDSERDIHIGGLGAVTSDTFPDTFAYVALGHLHRPQTTDTAGRVRYSGSPIALSFSEAGDCKQVIILDVTTEGISRHGLPIPLFRRLAQIRTTNAELETAMKEFDFAPGEFRTWVEVVVEDATLEDDLNERVLKLADERGVEVLKVLRGRPASVMGMSAGEATDDEAIETLLDQPLHVFDHLLGQHGELDEKEIEKLKATFAVLVDLDAQSEPIQTP